MGITIIYGVVFSLVNIMTDIAYGFLDPGFAMAETIAPGSKKITKPNSLERAARWENMRRGLYRFRSNRLSLVGLGVLVFFIVIAIVAPYVVPFPQDAEGKVHALDRLQPPSNTHPFGTDKVGRDIFSRVLLGTPIALQVGIVIIFIAASIGVTLGGIAGYFGGWVDEAIMRFTDIFLTVPALVLAMAITAALGRGIVNTMIGISLVWWPGFARLTRSLVLSLREESFVEAARGMGASNGRVLFRHILPNAVSPIIVKMSTDFGFAVLTAAALGFIGLGAQPPDAGMGGDDQRRSCLFPTGMVDRHVSGYVDLVACIWAKSLG